MVSPLLIPKLSTSCRPWSIGAASADTLEDGGVIGVLDAVGRLMTRDIPWGNSAHASGTIDAWRATGTPFSHDSEVVVHRTGHEGPVGQN
jgi:hypothetical protein